MSPIQLFVGRRLHAGIVGLILGLLPVVHASAQDQGEAAEVNALKKLSLTQLMDVEVTSVSLWPEKLSQAPSAIQVITGDEIRRSGATVLPEALRLADNLDVAQRNPHDWNVSARGFNTDLTNKLLVLIDGRTVYTPLFSGVFWDVQDYLLEDIDRIEVVSGPGGTLWGANAVNGVINVTTRSTQATQGLFLETAGGSELSTLTGARYGGTLAPGVTYRIYGKYVDQDSGVFGSGARASDGWNMGRGGFRLDADSPADGMFTLQGDYYDGREDVITGGASRVDGDNLVGHWTQAASNDSSVSLLMYYDRTHLATPKPANSLRPAGVLTDDLGTYDVDFQQHLRLNGRNQLAWGLGYRFTHDDVANAPTVALIPARLDQTLASAFAQDELTWADQLTLTFGTKVENNQYTGFEFEPSVRFQRPVADGQMVWAAVSRAVRTPSRVDRDLIQPTGLPSPYPQSILTGSPEFRSETVVAYESGYRARLGDRVTASISLFYNNYDHVRSITPGPAGPPSFGFPLLLANNLEGETHGAELSATFTLADWWRLRSGFNLLREHLRVKPGAVDFSDALNETADPHHQFTVHSSMDLPRRIQLDAGLRWVDVRRNNNGPVPGFVPSYAEMDLRVGWRPNDRVELSVVGQNLLHDHHPEYGYPNPTREEIERSAYAKAAWRF